jgi:hypothetical protein
VLITLQEVWNGKREFLEKVKVEILEERSGDSMNNRLHVSASTFEHKPAVTSEG